MTVPTFIKPDGIFLRKQAWVLRTHTLMDWATLTRPVPATREVLPSSTLVSLEQLTGRPRAGHTPGGEAWRRNASVSTHRALAEVGGSRSHSRSHHPLPTYISTGNSSREELLQSQVGDRTGEGIWLWRPRLELNAKAEADFLAEVSRSPQQGLPERFCRGSEDTEMNY